MEIFVSYLIQRGGVSRIMVLWVGFARTPLSFNLMHISKAETEDKVLLFSSTALNKPFPRISFITLGNCCCTFVRCCLSSCPIWADLQSNKIDYNPTKQFKRINTMNPPTKLPLEIGWKHDLNDEWLWCKYASSRIMNKIAWSQRPNCANIYLPTKVLNMVAAAWN